MIPTVIGLPRLAPNWWSVLVALVVALSMAGCGNETFSDISRVPDSVSREPVVYPQCPGLNREWLQEPTGLHEPDKEVHTLALQWLPDGSGVLFTNGTRLYTAAADPPGLQLLHDAAGEIAVETTGGDTLGRSSTGVFDRSDLLDDSEVTSDGPVRFAAERLTAASIAADGSKIAVAVCRKPAEGQTFGGLAEGGLDVPAGKIWIAISHDLHEIIVTTMKEEGIKGRRLGKALAKDLQLNEILMVDNVSGSFATFPHRVFNNVSEHVGIPNCRGGCALVEEHVDPDRPLGRRVRTADIYLNRMSHWSEKQTFIDLRGVDQIRLNTCPNTKPENREEQYHRPYGTLVHEAGHALGLDHPTNLGPVMSYTRGVPQCSPHPFDVLALMALYQSRGERSA